jgi:hypothetical protein
VIITSSLRWPNRSSTRRCDAQNPAIAANDPSAGVRDPDVAYDALIEQAAAAGVGTHVHAVQVLGS